MARMAVVLAVATALLILVSGCSAKLKVWSEHCPPSPTGNYLGVQEKVSECKGLPFRITEAYVVEGKYIKNAAKPDKECKEVPFIKVVNIPTEEIYFVTMEPPAFVIPFVKNELTIDMDANSTVDKVILNADPEISETVSSVAALVGAVRGEKPEQGATPQQEAEASRIVGMLAASPNPQSGSKPLVCDSGAIFSHVMPASAWVAKYRPESE